MHVASPYTLAFQDAKKDLLDPAIRGTLNVFEAAQKAGVKRIVLTSSIAAMIDPSALRGLLPCYC